MAYKISNRKDEVTLKCEALIINGQGGETRLPFKTTFGIPSTEERKKMRDVVLRQSSDSTEFLRDWVRGWDQIFDENDDPLDFNEENLDMLIGDIYIADAMASAFGAFLYDSGGTRLKN